MVFTSYLIVLLLQLLITQESHKLNYIIIFFSVEETGPYHEQLNYVKYFLSCDDKDRSDEEIVKRLGTSIAALYSVPTAIYCFLRAQEEIPGIKVFHSNFHNVLIYFK